CHSDLHRGRIAFDPEIAFLNRGCESRGERIVIAAAIYVRSLRSEFSARSATSRGSTPSGAGSS
ncbi:MAG: hypothetical protein VCE43_13205, partial [Myxococcota bacterium]